MAHNSGSRWQNWRRLLKLFVYFVPRATPRKFSYKGDGIHIYKYTEQRSIQTETIQNAGFIFLVTSLTEERNFIKCKLTLEYLQKSPCISIWRIFQPSFMQINQILELSIPIKEFSCDEFSRLDLHKRGKQINQNENTQKNLIPNLCTSGLSESFKKKIS